MVATKTRRYTRDDWADFAHTGPGTLAGRFMRMFWQPVYRSQDLDAGYTKPLMIMSEEFTLYRGKSGTAYAVAFRCAHRGTQLSVGKVEGENIRCFYHGWMYDGSGQCVEQPAEQHNTDSNGNCRRRVGYEAAAICAKADNYRHRQV